MCVVPGGLGGIGDPVEGPDNVRSDGVHYLRLPVLEPLEFFPVFCFPPFLFLALRPELESLAEAAAFWAGAFFSEFFLVRGVDFAFLFVEAPPVGEWPLCPFFAFVSCFICFSNGLTRSVTCCFQSGFLFGRAHGAALCLRHPRRLLSYQHRRLIFRHSAIG